MGVLDAVNSKTCVTSFQIQSLDLPVELFNDLGTIDSVNDTNDQRIAYLGLVLPGTRSVELAWRPLMVSSFISTET